MTALLFVGESPPAGSPPDFRPFDCASGTRLADVLGLIDRTTPLEHVPMRNLFAVAVGVPGAPRWDAGDARWCAQHLSWHEAWRDGESFNGRKSIVALGRRVADAFDLPAACSGARVPVPAILTQWRHNLGPLITYAPHPSGSSQALNDPATRAAVRRTLLPELVLGCPSLRPWHFRLDDPAILADLAVAVAPSCVAVGVAALLWARAQHVARAARLASPLLAKVDAALLAPASPLGWDHSLSVIAQHLREPDGARSLARAWRDDTMHGNTTDRWLLKTAEDHDAVASAVSRDVARATTMRYLLAEVSP